MTSLSRRDGRCCPSCPCPRLSAPTPALFLFFCWNMNSHMCTTTTAAAAAVVDVACSVYFHSRMSYPVLFGGRSSYSSSSLTHIVYIYTAAVHSGSKSAAAAVKHLVYTFNLGLITNNYWRRRRACGAPCLHRKHTWMDGWMDRLMDGWAALMHILL